MHRSAGQNPPFGTSMEPGPWLHANLSRSWGPAIGLFRDNADVVRGVLARLRPVATCGVPRALGGAGRAGGCVSLRGAVRHPSTLAVARAGNLGWLGGRRLG